MNSGMEWTIADGRFPREAIGGLFIARALEPPFNQTSNEPAHVRFGSLADKPSRAKSHQCPLWSKSGQTLAQLDCPLSANSGHQNAMRMPPLAVTVVLASDMAVYSAEANSEIRRSRNQSMPAPA